MRFFAAFLLIFVLSACNHRSEEVVKHISPLDFSGYCVLDWTRSGDLEISAILDIAGREKYSRSCYYSIMSHLGNQVQKKQNTSVSNDIRLSLLDRAVCFMTAELFPQYVPVFAGSRRRAACVEVLANIREYKALENSGLISGKEREEFETLLLVTGSSMDINMRTTAELFDYHTLPKYQNSGEISVPKWIDWTEETVLLWSKLLMQLPQETRRTPGVDHSKVTLYAMKISHAIARRISMEHMIRLTKSESKPRSNHRADYEKSLAYAWQIRFPDPDVDGDFKKEEQFLSDLWQLMQ